MLKSKTSMIAQITRLRAAADALEREVLKLDGARKKAAPRKPKKRARSQEKLITVKPARKPITRKAIRRATPKAAFIARPKARANGAHAEGFGG